MGEGLSIPHWILGSRAHQMDHLISKPPHPPSQGSFQILVFTLKAFFNCQSLEFSVVVGLVVICLYSLVSGGARDRYWKYIWLICALKLAGRIMWKIICIEDWYYNVIFWLSECFAKIQVPIDYIKGISLR